MYFAMRTFATAVNNFWSCSDNQNNTDNDEKSEEKKPPTPSGRKQMKPGEKDDGYHSSDDDDLIPRHTHNGKDEDDPEFRAPFFYSFNSRRSNSEYGIDDVHPSNLSERKSIDNRY